MRSLISAAALILILCCGCAKNGESAPAAPQPTETPRQTAMEAPKTPEPAPAVVTIGAVGDVMIMPSQIAAAYDEAGGVYDFSRSFAATKDCLSQVDLMCGNLETTLAGEAAKYTKALRSGQRTQLFNAPDALADALKDAGFDLLTTANNHCLDKGGEGLKRTIGVLRSRGLFQTGTARSEGERNTPLIIKKNGIAIGIVAMTVSVNNNLKHLPVSERDYAVSLLSDEETRTYEDIAACRAAGADVVIAFPHWGVEDVSEVVSGTRIYAKNLLAAGADVVLGSHPHRVQEIEFLTVDRNGTPYTGLVVYSMGNYLSNMLHIPEQYGLFVKLTIEKDPSGRTALKKTELLPLLSVEHETENRGLHEVLPAWNDINGIHTAQPLTEMQLRLLGGARTHVETVCLTQGVSMMEDLCSKSSEN